jgi:hypothetical protein
MSKYEVISEWLKTCDQITNWLYFNAILMEENNVSITPISGGNVIPYIDGSSERELLFAIDFVQAYDTETSTTNLRSIEDTLDVIEWVKTQTVLPDFGDGFETESIEVDDEVPGTLVDQDNHLCKYQYICKIKFFQE